MTITERDCRARLAHAFADWHYAQDANSLARFDLLEWLYVWAGLWKVAPRTPRRLHQLRRLFHGGLSDDAT